MKKKSTPADVIKTVSKIVEMFPAPAPIAEPATMPTREAMRDMMGYLKNATTMYPPTPNFTVDDMNRVVSEGRLNEAIELCEAARWIVANSTKAPNHYRNQVRDTAGIIMQLKAHLDSSHPHTSAFQFQITLNEIRVMISYAYELMS